MRTLTLPQRNRENMDAGDVLARESEICSHGERGYCYDDATPDERAAVDALYRHAFEYAEDEGYAAWIVARCWTPGAFYLTAATHSRDYEEYLSGPKEPKPLRSGRRTR